MRKIAKILWVVLAVLPLASPPEIDLVIERVGDRFSVTMSQNWGIIFSNKEEPCIGMAGVYPRGSYNPDDAVWLIRTSEDIQCLDISSFVVGEVPAGFKETVPLKADISRPYVIRVHGIGSGETELKF
jgi:hypothetical protein